MARSSHYISCPGGRLHYRRWGQGDQLIIAFHGFANQGNLFEPIALACQDRIRLVAIDLPHHGRTQWEQGPYGPADVSSWVQQIMEEEVVQTFSWLGFSYGARLGLSMCRRLPAQLDAMHLIAPDGLATYRTFYSSMVPRAVRRQLHRWVAARPKAALGLAHRLHDLRILDHFSLLYLEKQLSSARQLDRLFNTWLSLPAFPVRSRQAAAWLDQQPWPVHLYLGRRDQFVDSRAIARWAADISTCQLHLFDQGHQLINYAFAEYFRTQL